MRRAAGVHAASLLLLTFSVASVEAAADRASSLKRAEALRAARRGAAAPSTLVSPYYSVRGGRKVNLLVLSTTAEPIEVDVSATSPRGEVLPLGRHRVDPTRHLELALTDDLVAGGLAFREGALWLDFLGDDESLQAWLVLRHGRQALEISLLSPSDFGCRSFLAFWDSQAATPGTTPGFVVLNRSEQPRRIRFSSGRGALQTRSLVKILPPRRQLRVQPGPANNWVRVSHEGDPGDVVAFASLEGPTWLSRLQLWPLPLASGVSEFESVDLPVPTSGATGLDSAVLTLFNSSSSSRQAMIQVLDADSGTPIFDRVLAVERSQVVTVPLPVARESVGAVVSASAQDGSRVRVISDGPSLLVTGTSRFTTGEVVEVPFFAIADGHASGSYPIPPLHGNEVYVTVVNLDAEPSKIVGQFFWEGGTYSLGPIQIVGHGTYRLRVGDLVEDPQPDLLGRTLDPDYSDAFFKWIVQEGPRKLIARTEVQLADTEDLIGFNCYGCCWIIPVGSVEPGEVFFEPGESPFFGACISYETCEAGGMGPYLATVSSFDVPSPFSWDGENVSASAASSNELEFTGEEEFVEPDCSTYLAPIDGIGTASSCKVLLRKTHNPTQSWDTGQTCTSQVSSEPGGSQCTYCYACCNAIRAYWLCERKYAPLVEQEYQACNANCLGDACGGCLR